MTETQQLIVAMKRANPAALVHGFVDTIRFASGECNEIGNRYAQKNILAHSLWNQGSRIAMAYHYRDSENRDIDALDAMIEATGADAKHIFMVGELTGFDHNPPAAIAQSGNTAQLERVSI